MNTILVICVVVILVGGLLYASTASRYKNHKKIDLGIAEAMLPGIVKHEVRALLKGLQSKLKKNQIEVLLRNLSNVVVTYKRLGGDFPKLNDITEFLRLEIQSPRKRVPMVIFAGGSGLNILNHPDDKNPDFTYQCYIHIGGPGENVHVFDERYQNSLKEYDEEKHSNKS
ncbi:hypothetical protein ACFL15_01880 [Patescibacteria group bacterium]